MMKLNLVADYGLPGGKRFCRALAIHSSINLARLPEMTTLSFPAADGKSVYVAPSFLLMCESAKKAEAVADDWRANYKREGRLWDLTPVDPYWAAKEQESEAVK